MQVESGNPEPKQRSPKPKLHPILKWFRSAGIAAEVFGWAGLIMLGEWFWPAVVLVYCGFVLLAIDIWVEPDLRSKLGWRIVGVVVILLVTGGFSWAVVFVSAPLDRSGVSNNADYPEGTIIGGIAWSGKYDDLRVKINNPTEYDYRDVDVVLRPDEAIAAIGQVTNVPNVSFLDDAQIGIGVVSKVPEGSQEAVPMVLLATDSGYRVHCDRLPAKTRMEVVMAVADVETSRRQSFQKGWIVQINFSDGMSAWLRRQSDELNDEYWKTRRVPRVVHVDGKYTAVLRRHNFSETLLVHSITDPD